MLILWCSNRPAQCPCRPGWWGLSWCRPPPKLLNSWCLYLTRNISETALPGRHVNLQINGSCEVMCFARERWSCGSQRGEVVIIHPDPHKKFVVQVGTSNSENRVILLQWQDPDSKLHTMVCFRHCNFAERNYNVRKLGDTCHQAGLAGVNSSNEISFSLCRQTIKIWRTWWSLFFACFSFTITFFLSSATSNPMHYTTSFLLQNILPPTCKIGILNWETEDFKQA